MPEQAWTVRKLTNLLSPNWVVHDARGGWVGAYTTWRDAVNAASVVAHAEDCLKNVAQRPADGQEWTE